MNFFIPEFFDISTKGVKASRLISFPKVGFNSKLGSFEIQAKCITISFPLIFSFCVRSLVYYQLIALSFARVSTLGL